MLPYAGFYTLRGGWKPDDLFLFFRAGPTGTGHEHEDMLEVVLKRWGKTLLLDPGSALYDHSDWRRFIIGTAAHNTITVDGKWQHRGPSKAPVEHPVGNPWITTPLFDFVSGTYDGGYQTNVYNQKKEYQPQDWVGEIDRSVTHTRRVMYLRPYYVVLLDTVDGSGTHTADSHFNAASPSVRIDPSTQAAFSQNGPGQAQIALYPLDRDNLKVDVIQGEHGAPDIRWSVPTVQFSKREAAPILFATFLYPYRGDVPEFRSNPLALTGEDVWGRRIHTDKEDIEVALTKSGKSQGIAFPSLFDGNVSAACAGLTLRRMAGRSDVLFGGWAVTAFASKSIQFTVDTPANLLFRLGGDHPALLNSGSKSVAVNLLRPIRRTITIPSGAAIVVDASGTRRMSDISVFKFPD